MDWQNALTEKNAAYLMNEERRGRCGQMFFDFWWNYRETAGEELLKASAGLAKEKGIDLTNLYAGVDIQSNGYDTPIRWDLFENPEGGTYTYSGVYCPSWAYFSAGTVQDFWKQENKLWVNSKGDPSSEADVSAMIRSGGAVSNLRGGAEPGYRASFVNNFCMGKAMGSIRTDS